MEAGSSSGSGSRRDVIAVIGGIYVLSLLICLCLASVTFILGQQALSSSVDPRAAQASPAATSAMPRPAAGDQILKDDFAENTNDWVSRWSSGSVLVKAGQLALSSDEAGLYAMTECDGCPVFRKKIYLQADLSTDKAIDEGYGIAFNFENYDRQYYLFEINAVKSRYSLYVKGMNSNDSWMLRISRDSSLIKPYPETNQLGVSFENDQIQLFIDGQKIDSYADAGSNLAPGTFAFFVDETGFELHIDNLYAFGQ